MTAWLRKEAFLRSTSALFAGNLPREISDNLLGTFGRRYGSVLHVRVVFIYLSSIKEYDKPVIDLV